MRAALLWIGVLGLGLTLTAPGRGEETRRAKTALTDYFPPPESKGGWRTLLPAEGEPSAAQKAEIARKAGIDWDKLKEAWDHNAKVDGASGLLVIRKGYVVGEWYKGGDRDKAFNIYSSSKAYTSLAFGLLLNESEGGRLPGGKKLTLDTKVCNETWLPESLPLSDPRRADITLRHLLNMASGLGPENVPTGTEPFEVALGKTEKSPFRMLKADPGTKFYYSNAGVAHLVLVFRRAMGRDLFPFLKESVFGPVGMEKVSWQSIGGKGHLGPYSQGYSGVHTTPREHARFCYLAMHRGNWAGKQVVPSAHYDFAWSPSKANKTYGAQWWLEPRHKGAPADLVQTAGALNNHGYVVPSLDLVFVRLGDGRKFPKDWEPELVGKVLAAVAR
ncbi:MAG TPA: serine hydrolase [Gemmataceae bacterium]|nr:serine hydrolase [Gemmataceae bacterium]